MQYYSLQHQAPEVSFREAVLSGQAPDKGLYFPRTLPKLPREFIESLPSLSKEEIGEVCGLLLEAGVTFNKEKNDDIG